MERPVSAEQLNAYIDNQLDAEEAGLVLKALQESSPISHELCELHRVQDMVRHAYSSDAIPQRPAPQQSRWHTPSWQGIAASLLLLCGATAGWFAHDVHDPSMESLYLSAAPQRTQNVILHISTDDPVKVSDALDQAQLLLERNKKLGHSFHMEIVANGEGLNLLRARYSNFPERTEELIHNYDNLTVMACSKALQAIKAQGGDTKLLPNINTTDSALERVVTRLQDGWLYIKV
jgi:intracellular sulfur oxidation DsrE/DsrF family protein